MSLSLVHWPVQVVHSSPDCSAGALAAALAGLSPSPGQRSSAAGPGTPASEHANREARNGHAEPAEAGRAQEHDSAAGASASGSAEAGGSQSTSVFDPLSGSRAKSGATRVMPGGATGYYWWARMPPRCKLIRTALFCLASVPLASVTAGTCCRAPACSGIESPT